MQPDPAEPALQPRIDAALQQLRELCARMPPVAAMRIDVAGFDGERLQLRAPLAANVNDKHNAFGGSLASLMTLAGWALVNLQLRLRGIEAEVYVADSHIRYRSPLYTDLQAQAWLAEGEDWDGFFDTLARRGRARLQLLAETAQEDGSAAATLEARFVAIARQP